MKNHFVFIDRIRIHITHWYKSQNKKYTNTIHTKYYYWKRKWTQKKYSKLKSMKHGFWLKCNEEQKTMFYTYRLNKKIKYFHSLYSNSFKDKKMVLAAYCLRILNNFEFALLFDLSFFFLKSVGASSILDFYFFPIFYTQTHKRTRTRASFCIIPLFQCNKFSQK